MKTGIELIAKERQEQIEKHGYTDVGYNENGELIQAAAFALGAGARPPSNWESHFEQKMGNKNMIESLAVAGALIAAEIDRLQRKKEVNMSYTEQQIEEWKHKAEKWDNLGKRISKYYLNKNGEYDEENPEVKGDLCGIGEEAAIAFRWL